MAAISQNTLKRIFLTENVSISIKISLKFVRKGSVNNIAALFQIMAWRLPEDKPLSEPMVASLPTHICVTWPQWVKKNTEWSHIPQTYMSGLDKCFDTSSHGAFMYIDLMVG